MRIIDLLETLKIPYWIEGGWGIDILLGKEHRPHHDIDVDFDASREQDLLDSLIHIGYVIEEDERPTRVSLHHPLYGYIDCHLLVLHPDGSASQKNPKGGWFELNPSWFTHAFFEGRRISCYSVEAQKLFHSGYSLRPIDTVDLRLLRTYYPDDIPLVDIKTPIILIKPSMRYAQQILEYKTSFENTHESLAGCGSLERINDIEEWFEEIEQLSNSDTCPPHRVPSDQYLAIRVQDHRLVGMINFRHHIDHPILSVWGGHIGYSVHPQERRKGYAKEMLRQTLLICKAYGLDRVLVTCDQQNMASKKTILANGGVYESGVLIDGNIKERYWINL